MKDFIEVKECARKQLAKLKNDINDLANVILADEDVKAKISKMESEIGLTVEREDRIGCPELTVRFRKISSPNIFDKIFKKDEIKRNQDEEDSRIEIIRFFFGEYSITRVRHGMVCGWMYVVDINYLGEGGEYSFLDSGKIQGGNSKN